MNVNVHIRQNHSGMQREEGARFLRRHSIPFTKQRTDVTARVKSRERKNWILELLQHNILEHKRGWKGTIKADIKRERETHTQFPQGFQGEAAV